MKVKLTAEASVQKASVKLGLLAAAGLAAGLLAGTLASWKIAPLVAWDTLAFAYVAATWLKITKYDAALVKKHATREDPSRVASDLILIGASVASLGAVAVLLAGSASSGQSTKLALTALGMLSVIASWLMVHTVYALRYAELYYSQPEGGVDFGGQKPQYVDFAYLAFTIGMTYQVSDTTLTTRAFRATALKHALLGFLLGTVIIATTINLVAGLVK
ncbi:MAG TPA: DUF1345 domain-containing protein [Candidatus Saccharimonadia bacterium]|nr:DUF1345 domain-containing protein [Candidatus Saccharimonadia bacterium]